MVDENLETLKFIFNKKMKRLIPQKPSTVEEKNDPSSPLLSAQDLISRQQTNVTLKEAMMIAMSPSPLVTLDFEKDRLAFMLLEYAIESSNLEIIQLLVDKSYINTETPSYRKLLKLLVNKLVSKDDELFKLSSNQHGESDMYSKSDEASQSEVGQIVYKEPPYSSSLIYFLITTVVIQSSLLFIVFF